VLTVNELQWEAQQIENRVRIRAERRVWITNFAIVFTLILLTLAVATALVHLRGVPSLSL
jgi:hypothetical protein